jgi:hypothetical protein
LQLKETTIAQLKIDKEKEQAKASKLSLEYKRMVSNTKEAIIESTRRLA